MARLHILLTLICVGLVTGCAGPQTQSPARPAWVASPDSGVESNGALGAVGVGPTRQDAERLALARLAQRILVQVQGVERTREDVVETSSARGSMALARDDARRSAALSREVELRWDRDLPGARIAATWQDPATDEWHALAMLDRAEGIRAIATQLDRARRDLRDAWRRSAQSGGRLERYQALRVAQAALHEAEDLEDAMIVIAGGARADEAFADVTALVVDAAEMSDALRLARRQLRVAIEASTDTPVEVDSAVRAVVHQLGLPLAISGGAELVLRAHYDASFTTTYDANRRVARWRVRVDVVDAASGVAMDSASESGRMAGLGLSDPRREGAAPAAAAARRMTEALLDRVLNR